jgi:tetratricopeptide (TPR) repeat protein
VARESTFRFRGPEVDPDTLLGILGATYCLSGSVELQSRRLTVSVELSDTRSKAVVWADRLSRSVDDLHEARSTIASSILAALELQIPLNEAALARSQPSERLDAWGSYHLGLQHMFRFNRHDNAIAAGHFERATQLDPNFASAFAAWSFTSYQAAAMGYSPDRPAAIAATQAHADRSIELDPMDPFANFAQGRLHFLLGHPDDRMTWLDRSVQLSPSYAKGYYSRGLADMLSSRAPDCHENIDTRLALSPLDPLLCAMQSTKSVAYLLQGNYEEAARWAVRGARAPQAHTVIVATAVAACQLAGDPTKARYWSEVLYERQLTPPSSSTSRRCLLPIPAPGSC